MRDGLRELGSTIQVEGLPEREAVFDLGNPADDAYLEQLPVILSRTPSRDLGASRLRAVRRQWLLALLSATERGLCFFAPASAALAVECTYRARVTLNRHPPAQDRWRSAWLDNTALRIVLAACVPLVLLLAGTIGYHTLEGWTLFDSLYMTVTTLATVGFGEIHPLSSGGRAFTIALILGGVFTTAAAATTVIRAVVSGELQRLVGRRRMERMLSSLAGHVIVCGYGRMGRFVCEELAAAGQAFVAIERDKDLIERFPSGQGIAFAGDATSDDVLRRAGIERARAVVTALPHDADNLFITMSAKLLNDKLFIVSRAEDPTAEAKLTRAGANRVVAPYHLGGARVVQAVLRPAVLDFIDLATKTQHIELQMEETALDDASVLVGKTLSESMTGDRRIIVVAVKRKDGRMEFNPSGATRLEGGDTLISLGHRHDLDRLETMARK